MIWNREIKVDKKNDFKRINLETSERKKKKDVSANIKEKGIEKKIEKKNMMEGKE